jgi:phosphonate transport system substrate-binding protein
MPRIPCISQLLLLVLSALSWGADELPILRLGIPPWQKSQTVDEIREQYRPVLTWLGNQIGYRFVVVGGRSYEEMIGLIALGEVHLAELSPVPYVQAKRQNPDLELLVTELKWNEDHSAQIDSYEGYIVALRSRADVNAPGDLRGKKVAFVNLESSSGWRYPNAELTRLGIDIRKEAAQALFLGSHPRVTDAVAAGSVDAGATWDYNLKEATRQHGDIFKIVLKTPPIPNICMVAHPQLAPALRARIRDLLIHADPALFASAPMQGYVVRPDAFYDVVRTLIDAEKTSGH